MYGCIHGFGKLKYLGSCLFLAWILWFLGSVTVYGINEGELPVSKRESRQTLQTEGVFTDPAAHWMGRYHLRRVDGVVTATFSSTRSPVQHHARQLPTVLFTIPAGFRPVAPITWAVEAWHVQADGSPHPSLTEPVRFLLRVHKNGTVRYVDNDLVNEIGFLRYSALLTWITHETSGTYSNLQANHEGRYYLQRIGSEVSGSFSSTRSPVQYFARTRPEILFVIPKGFRPSQPVTVTVTNARHVDAKGRDLASQSTSRKFDLQVETNGTVRYVNNAKVNRVGYLRYSVEVNWPTAVPGPQVCQRPPSMQRGIQGALHLLGLPEQNCLHTGWEQLALIKKLESWDKYHEVLQFRDLSGLGGLETGTINMGGTTWPSGLLAQTPRLTSLRLYALHPTELPASLLGHSPHLTSLEIVAGSLLKLPAGFLVHSPQISSVRLEATQLQELPAGLLHHTPQLTDLYVNAFHQLKSWPDRFLDHTPNLERVVLYTSKISSLPDNFLGFAPKLHYISLQIPATGVPEGFLANSHQLHRVYFDISLVRRLPADFLVHSSELEFVSLYISSLPELPTRFLSHTPHLTEAEFYFGALQSLPTDFLAHAPQLERLDLQVPPAVELPENFLTRLPNLKSIYLGPVHVDRIPDHVWAQLKNQDSDLYFNVRGESCVDPNLSLQAGRRSGCES